MIRHPISRQTYERLADGTVLVADESTGAQGVFAVGGRWLSGDLRYADAHLIRWVHDTDSPQRSDVSMAAAGERGSTDGRT